MSLIVFDNREYTMSEINAALSFAKSKDKDMTAGTKFVPHNGGQLKLIVNEHGHIHVY
ncbi:MAG: hypothetical protein J5525_12020 [Lachnospiraceae bacterium]|nr:hypothetical protein [Lachnospiraceae bacterium]